MWRALLVLGLLAVSPLFAQTLPSCSAECAAQRVRLVVEDSPQGGWRVKPGEERRYRDVENELGRLAESLEPLTADESIAAVEITFPRPADPAIEAQLHALVAAAGFDLRGPVRALRNFGADRVAALYLREPRRILAVAADDERSRVISSILLTHGASFVWSQRGDELELWTASDLAPHCASLLALSDELDRDELRLDPPMCAGALPRAAHAPHKRVVLSGEHEAEAFEALRAEARQPSRPWTLEVLCDVDTLDAVIDTVTAPVFAQGAWRNRGFSYAWLGLPEVMESELLYVRFAVAPRRMFRRSRSARSCSNKTNNKPNAPSSTTGSPATSCTGPQAS